MANVANNFLQYGINARSAYSVNNAANAPAIGNWTAVKVDAFRAASSGFAAQLYTDGQGNYRVAMRGTDELRGDLPPDVALATGRWHGQMTDAIRFMNHVNHGVRSCNQTNHQLTSNHGETLANRISRRAVPRHLAWRQARSHFSLRC